MACDEGLAGVGFFCLVWELFFCFVMRLGFLGGFLVWFFFLPLRFF